MKNYDRCSLILHCVECGAEKHVPFKALTLDSLPAHLAAGEWFVSVVTPPGEPDVVLAPVCATCAPEVLPAEIIATAKSALKKERS